MLEKFKRAAEEAILDGVVRNVNTLVGVNTSHQGILQLLTATPIEIEPRLIVGLKKPAKKLGNFDEHSIAYCDKGAVAPLVKIALFYGKQSDLKRVLNRIKKNNIYFSALYLRESLKLLNLMYTRAYYDKMSKHIPNVPKSLKWQCINTANNYYANNVIYRLFSESSISRKFREAISVNNQFDSVYINWTVPQILEDICGNIPNAEEFENWGDFMYSDELGVMPSSSLLIDEDICVDVAESIESHLSDMSRGTASAAIFDEAFQAKKVKTGWLKRLKRLVDTKIFHITSRIDVNWAGLNNSYRNHFKSPKKQGLNDKMNIILSIDHSGSVTTSALQKLLYLISKQGKNIGTLRVLIHDTEIVKEEVFKSDTDISTVPGFLDALGTRKAVGGTSHRKVFERISEVVEDTAKPADVVYISYSDNYSDIVESWEAYHKMKKIGTVIFLATSHNPMNIPNTVDLEIS